MTRKQIMVIDDDNVMLLLMKNQLEALYDVVTFSSGAEALEELNKTDNLPNLILLDIGMREMDGYEVLGRLKASEKLKMIPVVFLTGMTDEVSECRGLEMDVVDYLKKPVAGKVLFARVQHYIELYSDVENKGKLDESLIASIPEPLTERELETARLMAEFRS
ncbi:MAG: response regulator, partial [Lachnospiraceae bacterium]|nr:response regulator [Lachnospiraceae bacterium]